MTTRILALLLLFVLTPAVTAQDAKLITTFTNPRPSIDARFGSALAVLGSDRVIIGAPADDTGATDAGTVYLFNSDGALMTTITNPSPADYDQFGVSVAAVGNDRMVIGAWGDDTGADGAGAAYLYSMNGTLLTTITNPTPAEYDGFGLSVAGLGGQALLVGALYDDTSADSAGAAYLFSTNGTLLTTFTNPTPAYVDLFGLVSSLGTDRVVISASRDSTGALGAGAAYLFSTNGALLTTITNPTPATDDNFGNSVAAVGIDRVLIGAWMDKTGAGNAGAAYLFDTSGTLLTTFTNSAPAISDYFGIVAAVGSDRILISAFLDDLGADDAGTAYLFSTNGTLLTTITNPSPATEDWFGRSVAAVGNDRALIGALLDDTGATNSGIVYLFALPPTSPSLTIAPVNQNLARISWAPNALGFELQETQLLSPANWTNSPSGATNPTDVPATSQGKYFRLIKP